MSFGKKILELSEFLGLKRNILVLLGVMLLASTGERLWLGFAPKYLETLGASVFLIGVFDAVQTILGALYAYPGAWLTDWLGQRKSLLIFNLIALGGYLLVYFWVHPLALIVGSFLFLAWSAFSLPATFSVVATTLKKEKHTMGIGVQSFIRRIPMMIGPLIGGWLIGRYSWEKGVHLALLLCIGLSVLSILLQAFMQDKDGTHEKAANSHTFLQTFAAFPPHLRELLLSDILIRFCERIPYAFVVLWAIDHAQISPEQFGILVSIEMITAMFCYIPVAHLADRKGQRPFVMMTFIFFTLFPVSLLFAHNFWWLAFAFFIRGLKEFGEPARKALIIAYAPRDLKSKAYGVYYLIRDCVVTSGSFLGAYLWKISPQTNFFGAAIFGALGSLWFYIYIFGRKPLASP